MRLEALRVRYIHIEAFLFCGHNLLFDCKVNSLQPPPTRSGRTGLTVMDPTWILSYNLFKRLGSQPTLYEITARCILYSEFTLPAGCIKGRGCGKAVGHSTLILMNQLRVVTLPYVPHATSVGFTVWLLFIGCCQTPPEKNLNVHVPLGTYQGLELC